MTTNNPFTKRREPIQFLLWLGITGSLLIFTILIAIYMLRKSSPDWVNVPLPQLFWVSTAVIIASSTTLYFANNSFRSDQFLLYRILMSSTLALGVLFIALQLFGWHQLILAGVSMNNNPSAGFIYVFSGLHILHIFGGVIALGWAVVESLKNYKYVDSFVYSVNPPNQLKIKLITLYWHFVDVLWLYIFVFLVYQHGIL
jgi:cytochrome c oxidase subunit III